MNENLKIFGAKAEVYLKYNGELIDLAKILSKGLMLPEFYYDNDEEEPHEILAMCESFGFEIWLGNSHINDFSFLLRVETEHSFKESFRDQMYDLSPWLARFIAEICDIESCILEFKNNERILFQKRSQL